MPSTHTALHAHIVFSTKDREPLLMREVRSRVHAFLGGSFREYGLVPLEIGGVADHIHGLVGFKPTHRLSDVMRDVKKGTSAWIHDELRMPGFAWQEGYGAFAVNRSSIDAVRRYIQTQEERHKKMSFQDEYRRFLELNGIDFDERYLW